MKRENEYVLKEVPGGPWVHPLDLLNTTVKFRNHAAPGRELPLPNPHFIALYAGISRVLHMSGAAEVFDQIIDRYDKAKGSEGGLLKCNGDSVNQLSSMISALYIQEGAPLIK
jgi:hypothetical protein